MGRWHVVTIVATVAMLTAAYSPAGAFTFTKIVDTNTPMPGTNDTFDGVGPASLRGGAVAFAGGQHRPFGPAGIYVLRNNVLDTVVDKLSPVPGFTGQFTLFTGLSFDGQSVAFGATSTSPTGSTWPGFYTNAGGPLRVVADSNTTLPGRTDHWNYPFLTFVWQPYIDQGRVLYFGTNVESTSDLHSGLFLDTNGIQQVVINSEQTLPDSANQVGVGDEAAIRGDVIAFQGTESDQTQGLYSLRGNQFQRIADDHTMFPGTGFSLEHLSRARISENGIVAFWGHARDPVTDSYMSGIFLHDGTGLETLLDTLAPPPGSTLPFQSLGPFSLGLDHVGFEGTHPTYGTGIYVSSLLDGTLTQVVRNGALIDGKTVLNLSLYDESMEGRDLLFGVSFTDGSNGLYMATIPEPSCVELCCISAWLYLYASSRRRWPFAANAILATFRQPSEFGEHCYDTQFSKSAS